MSYNPFSSRSISRWEDSYFGGFRKVLNDYPYLKSSNNILFEFPTKLKKGVEGYVLAYWEKVKLMNMYLLNLKPTTRDGIAQGSKIEVNKETGKKYYVLDNQVLKDIMNKSGEVKKSEIGPLFKNYYGFISKTKIKIEVPEKDEKGSGEGEGGGEGEGQMDQRTGEILGAIAEIKEPIYGTNWIEGGDRTLIKPIIKLVSKTAHPVKFTPKEKIDGERLAQMLDISFDPRHDRVTNLKAGKMDANKIAEIPAGNMNVHYTIQENITTQPFSVCILVDESGSMGGILRGCRDYSMFENTKICIANSLTKMLWVALRQILPPEKIFIYGHTGDVNVKIYCYHDNYHPKFEETIGRQLDNDHENNYDGPAVEFIHERVRKQTDENVIFILISDGQPCNDSGGRHLKKAIEKCKRDKFVTVGVGLDFGQFKDSYEYYTIITSDNQDRVVMNVSNLINRVVKTEFQ